MIKGILTNQYFLLALTFGIYQGCKMLQRKTGSILLNPILFAIGLIILFLTACHIPYDTYHESAKLIDFWLKPAVVALGVPLYLQLSQIKKEIVPILASQMMGCMVGIVSVVVTARLLGASEAVVASLASKSVTTPIAMEVSQALGGIPSLTAAIVVITGLIGGVAGFKIMSVGHIHNPAAKGLSIGAAWAPRWPWSATSLWAPTPVWASPSTAFSPPCSRPPWWRGCNDQHTSPTCFAIRLMSSTME